MNRRKVWLGSVVALASAVAFVAAFPGYRLQREIAAARAEGVPLEVADLRRLFPKTPPDENAAPPIARAFSLGHAFEKREGPLDVAASNVIFRRATEGDRTKLRTAFTEHPELLARWRDLSKRPKLDYARDWDKGYLANGNENAYATWGGRRLVAAAMVGVQPEANLRAAARIAALLRGQPLAFDVLVGNSLAGQVLRAAKPLGLAKAVDAELGPPVDAWRSILPEPSRALLLLRDVESQPAEKGVRFWARRLAFWRSPVFREVHAWRELWRDLPKDGTDYKGVAAALDRWMPQLQGVMFESAGSGPVYATSPKGPGEIVRTFASFEAYRASVRR